MSELASGPDDLRVQMGQELVVLGVQHVQVLRLVARSMHRTVGRLLIWEGQVLVVGLCDMAAVGGVLVHWDERSGKILSLVRHLTADDLTRCGPEGSRRLLLIGLCSLMEGSVNKCDALATY